MGTAWCVHACGYSGIASPLTFVISSCWGHSQSSLLAVLKPALTCGWSQLPYCTTVIFLPSCALWVMGLEQSYWGVTQKPHYSSIWSHWLLIYNIVPSFEVVIEHAKIIKFAILTVFKCRYCSGHRHSLCPNEGMAITAVSQGVSLSMLSCLSSAYYALGTFTSASCLWVHLF